MKTYYVYMIECVNGAFYTGYTTDIDRRYKEHCNGKNCKYTNAFKPKRLIACWKQMSETRSQALKIENKIKGLTKVKKVMLSMYPERLDSFIDDTGSFIVHNA